MKDILFIARAHLATALRERPPTPPLYLLAQQFVRVNNIHAVLLLNVFVTAITGATLFIILRRLHYGRVVAFVVTLGYGLATTTWPYARTLLREPLVPRDGLMRVPDGAGLGIELNEETLAAYRWEPPA